MTRNTPGKFSVTECSSEKHDGPVATINACQAADYSLSHVYLHKQSTCKLLLKQAKQKAEQLCSPSA